MLPIALGHVARRDPLLLALGPRHVLARHRIGVQIGLLGIRRLGRQRLDEVRLLDVGGRRGQPFLGVALQLQHRALLGLELSVVFSSDFIEVGEIRGLPRSILEMLLELLISHFAYRRVYQSLLLVGQAVLILHACASRSLLGLRLRGRAFFRSRSFRRRRLDPRLGLGQLHAVDRRLDAGAVGRSRAKHLALQRHVFSRLLRNRHRVAPGLGIGVAQVLLHDGRALTGNIPIGSPKGCADRVEAQGQSSTRGDVV